MWGDWLLQPAEYARTISEQARTQHQHRDPGFQTSGLLVRIEELDSRTKTEKLKSLLRVRREIKLSKGFSIFPFSSLNQALLYAQVSH